VDDGGDGRGALAAAGLSCGSCGSQLSAAAKFCSECGTPVTQATQPAEYKQVTVLFADVVHSMDIAAAVGAERLREIMTELVSRAAAVVQRFGGTVDKFTGDGIMAVFGAPVALEDHAIRACLAALGVQEEANRLAVDIHDRDGIDLWVRVGLNSGQVIAGEIGSGPTGRMVAGVLASLAELELELGRERRSAAREARRARGQSIGRPKKLDESKAALAQRMHASGEPATTIASALGVSRATVYRVLADQDD
jgi:adenylate cyclase